MASEDITTLKFPECVIKRPGMYLATLEDASIPLREVIDNSIDELYRSKSAKTIDVKFDKANGIYTVADDGRGIPVKASKSNPDMTMTVESLSFLHSGSKFDNNDVSIGMNGVGSSAVSALSCFYEVYSKMSNQDLKLIPTRLQKIYNKESYYYCRFENGILKEDGFKNLKSNYSTIVKYKPNPDIFESVDASMPIELKYVKHIAKVMYNKDVKFLVNGKEYDVGLENLHTNIKLTGKNDINSYTILASVGLRTNYEPYDGDGSVNGLYVPNGLHIRWFHRAFAKAFNQMYGTEYEVDEIIYGLSMRIIMTVSEPNFSGQIKDNLVGIKGFPSRGEAESDKLILPILKELKKDRRYWDQHLKRIKSLIDAKNKINRQQLVKDTFDVDSKKKKNLPSKLMDCTTKNRKDAILYITEGNSASAGLIKSRDSKIHAILSLRGKMLNTVGKPIDEIIDNQEVRDLINAIGVGTKDYCNIKKLRYGKILIATDADSDGCFLGNEKVRLLNDKVLSFEELVELESKNPGSTYEVFSSDECGNIVPSKAHSPRITRWVDKLAVVTLSNDKLIRCTIDHRFMTNDLEYIKAESLKEGTKLKSDSNLYVKQVSIVKLEDEVPVYCMTVPDYGNFMLDTSIGDEMSGVIVHNCHIANLVLGCLYTHIPALFTCDKGNSIVYTVDCPLYKVGSEYYYTDSLKGVDTRGKVVERYKGLGSLSTEDLGDALMDPSKWHLTQITMTDCEEATNVTVSASLKGDLLVKAGVIKY